MSSNQQTKSYKEIYAASLQKDNVDIEQLSKITAKKAYLKLHQDELETEQALLTARQELSITLLAQPFTPKNIIAAEAKIESLEQGIERLKSLRQRYFADHKDL